MSELVIISLNKDILTIKANPGQESDRIVREFSDFLLKNTWNRVFPVKDTPGEIQFIVKKSHPYPAKRTKLFDFLSNYVLRTGNTNPDTL